MLGRSEGSKSSLGRRGCCTDTAEESGDSGGPQREKKREREREGGRSSGPATEDKKGEEGGIGSIVSVPRGGKGRGFGPRTLYSRWTVVDSASTGQGWDVFRTHWEALSGPWLRAVNARRRDGYRYRWKISPQE
jgi:hypothetical protein